MTKGATMTVIRVEPSSVRAYGTDAQSKFDEIRGELQKLVTEVTEVRYFGPNAVDFKTKAGQMAAEFARNVNQDLASIAAAVSAATSNIAASLGGASIVISVNPSEITPPAVATVDYVDVDTSALDVLKGAVTTHFTQIDTLFQAHMSKLASTDWQGVAKEQVVGKVQGFTTAARQKATEAQTAITNFIALQIEAALSADRIN